MLLLSGRRTVRDAGTRREGERGFIQKAEMTRSELMMLLQNTKVVPYNKLNGATPFFYRLVNHATVVQVRAVAPPVV